MKLKPIIPFEPIKTETIPQGNDWISQVKWDGVRLLTYYDGHEVRLFNRKRKERTNHYPELLNISSYCKARSVILDGEVIALDENGKPSFSTVMKRDGIRRIEKVKQLQNQIPIAYMVFDVIYYSGKWIHTKKLSERLNLLSEIIIPKASVQIVPSFSDHEALFQAIQAQHMEGIVVKHVNSPYYINSKNDRWQKKKNYLDLYAVVGGIEYEHKLIRSFLLGAYDENLELIYIGHAGTGHLKHSDLENVTKVAQTIAVKQCPFKNQPEKRKEETIWVKPLLTVKVQFLEWLPTKRLRQPVIQAFVHISPSECKLQNE